MIFIPVRCAHTELQCPQRKLEKLLESFMSMYDDMAAMKTCVRYYNETNS